MKIGTLLGAALPVCALFLTNATSALAVPCTVHDVSGAYAFLANGSVLVPGTPITGPFERIGDVIADGRGGLTIQTLAIYNRINFGPERFTGTYTVQADCTFDMI